MITKDFVFGGDAVFAFENTNNHGVNAGGKYTYLVEKVGLDSGPCEKCGGSGIDSRGYQNQRCKRCFGKGVNRPIFFANVLEDSKYLYMGVVNRDTGRVYHTKSSHVGKRDIRLLVLQDVMNIVFGKKKLADGYKLYERG